VLFGCWLLLTGPRAFQAPWTPADLAPELASDLAVGLLATAAALWVSLRLLPPCPRPIRFWALIRLVAHVLWQSMVAGLDVARRVFDPRLPIQPGFLAYPVRIPEGPARSAFGALTGLVPGTLPVGTDAHDALVYHCLDISQPVAAELASDEDLFIRVRGGEDGRV
jgi:multicomponent Na+:H+ antiporter subunit E